MKPWYKSKSIWSAIAKAIAGWLTSIALILNGELSLQEFLPAFVTSVWALIDIIIRFDTNQPIK